MLEFSSMSSSPVSKLEESEQIVELNAQLGQAKQVNAQLERLQEHLKMLIQNIQVILAPICLERVGVG